MRVVTLTPDSSVAVPTVTAPVGRIDCGELRAVSLEAFRAAFGEAWERIASRAMLRADQIIRRRLGRDDTVSRVDDHRFIIWFDSTDHERNETTLSAVVRDIRLRFLTEFGEEAAEHVSATLVPGVSPPPAPVAAPQEHTWLKSASAADLYQTASPTARWRDK